MGLFSREKKNKDCHVVGDSWESYFYTYGENQLAMIGFDLIVGKEEKHNGYKHCRRVIFYIPVERVQENGTPLTEEFSQLNNLEAGLLHTLQENSIDCKFVGRMTYGGMREYVFQVDDIRGFKKTVASWIQAISLYKIEIKELKGWDFFDEKIRPSVANWQNINDRKVIDLLIENGSKPDSPHILEHVFLGQKMKLEYIAQELQQDGFTLESLADDTLIISKPLPLNLAQISNLTSAFCSFAEDMEVKYDGWGAKTGQD